MTWPTSPFVRHKRERKKTPFIKTRWKPSLPSKPTNMPKVKTITEKGTTILHLTGLLSHEKVTRTLVTTGNNCDNRQVFIIGRHRLSKSISSWQCWCQSRRHWIRGRGRRGRFKRHKKHVRIVHGLSFYIWYTAFWMTCLVWFVRIFLINSGDMILENNKMELFKIEISVHPEWTLSERYAVKVQMK